MEFTTAPQQWPGATREDSHEDESLAEGDERDPSTKRRHVHLGHSPTYPLRNAQANHMKSCSGEPGLELEAGIDAITRAVAKERLDDTATINSLPNELLLRIAEFLIPQHVAIGHLERSFLRDRDREQHGWRRYFEGRQNLGNLGLTSRRLRDVAGPLLYRNIFVEKPSSLCYLIVHLAQNPFLGPLVRQMNSAVDLSPENFDEARKAWESVLPRYLAGKKRSDTSATSTILLDHLPHKWPNSAPGGMRTEFTGFLLASLLGLTNRIEKFGVLLPEPPAERAELSTMLKWLLDGGTWPFPNSHQEPHQNTTPFDCLPTLSQLQTAPSWPPPFLRNVAIEYDRGTVASGCNIHLDIVPHSEAVRHAALRRRCGFGSSNPTFVLDPLHLHEVMGTRHIDLLSYLDGLNQMPSVKSSRERLCEHIDDLRAATAGLEVAGTEVGSGSSRELARLLEQLQPAFTSGLAVRSKSLTLNYHEFLSFRPRTIGRELERSNIMANLESLDLRDNGRVSEDLTGTLHYDLSTFLRFFGEQYASLRRLFLRFLLSPRETWFVYGRFGRLQYLGRLTSLQELEITMEGLFGLAKNLGQLFGGQNFLLLDDRRGTFHSPENQSLAQIISSLPASLETLLIREWWHEYSHPADLLPVEGKVGDDVSELRKGKKNTDDCVERLHAIQKAAVEALATLAPVLKRHSNVKRVEFMIYGWKTKDAHTLMLDWLRTTVEAVPAEKGGKKITQGIRVTRVYNELGIEFYFKAMRRGCIWDKSLAELGSL